MKLLNNLRSLSVIVLGGTLIIVMGIILCVVEAVPILLIIGLYFLLAPSAVVGLIFFPRQISRISR